LPNRQPPAPPVATSSRQVRHIHHHHFNYILTEHACMNYHVCLLHLPARSLGRGPAKSSSAGTAGLDVA